MKKLLVGVLTLFSLSSFAYVGVYDGIDENKESCSVTVHSFGKVSGSAGEFEMTYSLNINGATKQLLTATSGYSTMRSTFEGDTLETDGMDGDLYIRISLNNYKNVLSEVRYLDSSRRRTIQTYCTRLKSDS